MTDGVLYIGHKRYSSWSMRGWLAVKLAGLDVDVRVLQFTRPGPTKAIAEISPNGLVPFLDHDGAHVWESLAICDYCAELRPALWPADRVARAHARSISAEMHAGFHEMRMAMWMNLGRDFSGLGRTQGALRDIARIEAIWAETRARFGGGGAFLFGSEFGAADAMFAPVVARFLGWKPEISATSVAYCAAVREHPLVREWYEGAVAEPAAWLIEAYETPPPG
jgi:glutathione S-transferase